MPLFLGQAYHTIADEAIDVCTVVGEETAEPFKTPQSNTSFTSHSIANYDQLFDALQVDAALAAKTGAGDLSLNLRVMRSTQFKSGTHTLLLRYIVTDHVKTIRYPRINVPKLTNLLQNQQFQESEPTFGTSYVSSITYGKELVIVIEGTETDKTDIDEMGAMLQATALGLSTEAAGKTSLKQNHREMKVNLHMKGSQIPVPGCYLTPEKLDEFVRAFGDQENDNLAPIHFTTTSYTVPLTSLWSRKDEKDSTQIMRHVTDYDALVKTRRALLLKADRLLNQIRIFDTNIADKKLGELVPLDELTKLRDEMHQKKRTLTTCCEKLLKVMYETPNGRLTHWTSLWFNEIANVINQLKAPIQEKLDHVSKLLMYPVADVQIASKPFMSRWGNLHYANKACQGFQIRACQGTLPTSIHFIPPPNNGNRRILFEVYRKQVGLGKRYQFFAQSGDYQHLTLPNDTTPEDKWMIANPQQNEGKPFSIRIKGKP